MKQKNFLTQQEAENIVFDYAPKAFPIVVTETAKGFVSRQAEETSDFAISELTAEQSGIREENRQNIEKQVENLALEKLQAIEEKAYAEAYEVGLIEGREKAFEEKKVEFEQRLEILDEYAKSFDNIKKILLEENEIFFIKAITRIAQKIAMTEIAENKELVLSVLENIVQEVQLEDNVTLHTSPEDYMFLHQVIEKSEKDFSYIEKAKIEINDHVISGGCILETNFGTIDATVEQRVDRSWEAVEGRLPKLIGNKIKLTVDGEEVDSSSNEAPQTEGVVEASDSGNAPSEEGQTSEEQDNQATGTPVDENGTDDSGDEEQS